MATATKTKVTSKRVTPKKDKIPRSKKSGVVLYEGSTAYVNCKATIVGHHFQKYAEINPAPRVVGCDWVYLQCVNCTYRKHVLMSKTGIVMRTRRYPPKDFPDVTMDRDEWRRAWYKEFYR